MTRAQQREKARATKTCPVCKAPPGQPCLARANMKYLGLLGPMVTIHKERRDLVPR